MLSSPLRERAGRILAIAVAASLLCGPLSPGAAADAGASSATSPVPARFASPDEWGAFMKQVGMPKRGCLKATYPYPEWIEVRCSKPPAIPFPPATGGGSPGTVGNGTDLSAVTTSTITEAIGSFDRVIGVTSVSSNNAFGSGAYTLQLNANFFSGSPACSGAAIPTNCLAWQQFIYASVSTQDIFMQYWLIDYDATCPAGWFTSGSDCYTNSVAVEVGTLPITELSHLSITATAAAGGTDRIIFSTGTELYAAWGEDSKVDLADFWNTAEFNVFGDCCDSTASFNALATIVVRTSVNAGTVAAPSCVTEGFTGETNNLALVDSAAVPPAGTLPYIVFTETNTGNTGSGESCHTGAGP